MIGLLLILGTAALAASLGLAIFGHNAVKQEVHAGLEILRTFRWKEFCQLVMQGFVKEGFKPIMEQCAPGEDKVDFVLTKNNERFLMVVKHGGAYKVGANAVRALIRLMNDNKANGGILVTSGRFDHAALKIAQGFPVLLLDDHALWERTKPFLPTETLDDVAHRVEDSKKIARQRSFILGAIGAGVILLGCIVAAIDYFESDQQPGVGNGAADTHSAFAQHLAKMGEPPMGSDRKS